MRDESPRVEIGDVTMDEVIRRTGKARMVVLTTHGEPVAAVLPIDELRRLTDERELLRRLALGELESAGGEGEKLDAVLEDCRLLLEEN